VSQFIHLKKLSTLSSPCANCHISH